MANETVVIQEYEELVADKPTLESFLEADKGPDFSPATFWAYCHSKGEGQSLLDFHNNLGQGH